MIKPSKPRQSARGKQANQAAPVENAPLSPLRGTYPRRGKFALRLLSCSISCSRHHAAKISPSGGDAAVGGRRGAFPAPSGRLFGFPHAKSVVVKVLSYWRHRRPPQPSGHRPVKPLNPLHLLNPHARQGVSMQAPKGGRRRRRHLYWRRRRPPQPSRPKAVSNL